MDAIGDRREVDYEEFDSGEMFAISAQKVRKVYEKMWRDTRKHWGLTQNEIDVLLFLDNHPQVDTAAGVASYCALSRSLVCKSVESLLSADYLTAQTDEHDRRFLRLKLTEKSREILKELGAQNQLFWNNLLAGVSDEERNSFLLILKKLRINLKQMGVDINK